MHLPKPPLPAEGLIGLDGLSPRTAKILRRMRIGLRDVGRYAARDLLMENYFGEKTLAELTRACILAGVEPPTDYRAFPLAWAAAEEARREIQTRPAVDDIPQEPVGDASADVLSDFRIDDLLAAIEQAIARIGDLRMETIARARILPGEFATLEELGERFGVTRENVRLIELRVLGRMRNGWQSDRLLSGLAQELNAGRGSFENAVLHLRALITRVAPKDSVDPVTIALVGVLGDPEILRVEVRKLTTEARRVIATARKANVLGIPIPDSIPHDLGGQGTGEVQVPRSDMDRMLAGELYGASAPLIQTELAATQRWLVRYNAALDLSPAARRNLLLERLAAVGEVAVIRPPFHCDFGFNIRLGERVFLNVNCVILDAVEVMIGERTQIGPGVQILTVDRPRDPAVRASGPAFGRPVRVGRNVRIGAGAIILPGVSISDDAVIGAGSVVTRDVPAGATTFGNPARVRT